jgi:hypothetical protein
MPRLRLLFPWLILIISGLGFIAGQFGSLSWSMNRSRIILGVNTGSTRVTWMHGPLDIHFASQPLLLREEFGKSWAYFGYRPDASAHPSRRAFAGFLRERIRLLKPPASNVVDTVAFPLWFPALLAGLWLIRRRFKRRHTPGGFEVLPSARFSIPRCNGPTRM